MTELLKQPQNEPVPFARQVMAIFAGTRGYLDSLPVERVSDFERSLLRFLEQNHPDLEKTITKEAAVSDDTAKKLRVRDRGLQARVCVTHAEPARHPPPHPQRRQHREDHQGDGAGGGFQAAPRPGADAERPPIRR